MGRKRSKNFQQRYLDLYVYIYHQEETNMLWRVQYQTVENESGKLWMRAGMRYVQYQFIAEIMGTSVTMAEDPKVAEEADVSAAFLDGPGAQWPSFGSGIIGKLGIESMMLFLEMVLALALTPRKQVISISVSMSPVKKDHQYKAHPLQDVGCSASIQFFDHASDCVF